MNIITAHLKAFFIALQFLTKLPVRMSTAPGPEELGRSMAYYPAIGLLIGAALCALDRALSMAFSPLFTSVMLVAAWALATGALHLDGFVDTADGLAAGPDRRRILAVMKDPATGSKGAAALVFLIAIKIALVAELGAAPRAWGLLLAPAFARWSMMAAAFQCSYARVEGGLGKSFVDTVGATQLIIASVIAAGAGIAALRWHFIVPGIAAILSTLLYTTYMIRKIGGITGDTLGALNELMEIAVLSSLLAAPLVPLPLPAFPL